MMQMYRIRNSAVALLLAAGLGLSVAAQGADQTGVEKVRQSLALLLPDIRFDSVEPSQVEGLYEAVVGTQLVYVTGDGRYLLKGEVIDIEKRESITQPRLNQLTSAAVNQVGEERMVIFSPQEIKHTITVFTDIDCGYCRKLHQDMAKYHERGINVRYLFYPRAGVNSDSYRKAVGVWCADDRKAAMTTAKSGAEVAYAECENPVQEHMQLGERLGVTGTPAIVLANGRMIPGYVPADRLEMILRQ
jgi:thiol:disulfide interchange protein DsbC